MGEGAALFVVKRLADAIRDEDRIYAVVRGVGSSATAREGNHSPQPHRATFCDRARLAQLGHFTRGCSFWRAMGPPRVSGTRWS